jgi:hypothetical protein
MSVDLSAKFQQHRVIFAKAVCLFYIRGLKKRAVPDTASYIRG